MERKKTHETEDLDALKREFRCVSQAPRFADVTSWFDEREAYYWGVINGYQTEYFLVRNPALMTYQCANHATVIRREPPIPVVFNTKPKEKKKTSWPGQQEIAA